MKKLSFSFAVLVVCSLFTNVSAQFDVSPNSISVAWQAGTKTYTVSTTVGWSVSDDASWLSATKTNGSTISVSYSENNSTSSRTANITASGTGGVTETVKLVQAGVPATLDISPNSLTVHPESGTSTFSVSSNVGWSVSDDATWLTTTKTDGSTITVSYDTNTSTSGRTASITAIGTGGVTETVRLNQEDAYISFNGPPQSVSAEAGSQDIEVSTRISEWSVSDDAAWVTVTRTTGTNSINVSWEANPSTNPREANITVTGTGEITNTATFRLSQAGEAPLLSISPNFLSIPPESGTSIFTVSANVGWSILNTSDWLTATKTDGSTFTIDYDANSSDDHRSGLVAISGTGDLVAWSHVIQDGASINFVDPTTSVGAGYSSQEVEVRTAISEWSVSDDAAWVTVTRSAGTNFINVSWEANSSTSSREANITVSGTGELTNSNSFTLTQAGAAPSLSISPGTLWATPESGSTTLSVTSNVGWSVTVDKTWLTATKTDGGTITISYDRNEGHLDRQAHITATGTGGVSETVTLYQDDAYIGFYNPPENLSAEAGSQSVQVNTRISEWTVSDDASWLTINTSGDWLSLNWEANPSTSPREAIITVAGTGEITNSNSLTLTQTGAQASINVSPDSKEAGPESGSAEFDVSSNVGWSVSDDADWLSATKTDGSTISVSYDSFSSTQNRTANITVTGTGGVSETVTFTQIGNPYIEIDPKSYEIGPYGNMMTIPFNTNIDWTVSDDVSWLAANRDGDAHMLIFVSDNPTTSPRTATITVSGAGLSETITIIQASLEPSLVLEHAEVNVGAINGTLSNHIVTNSPLWTVSTESTWLTVNRINDTRIDVTYDANPSTQPRSASITVDATGGVTASFTVNQEGAEAFLDVYPNTQTLGAQSFQSTLQVSSTVEWEVSDDANWLTAMKIDDNNIYIEYIFNHLAIPRTAVITVSGTGGLTETVTLTQEAAVFYANFTPESYSVDAASGTLSFEISSNADWSVTANVSWLSVEKTDANTISASYETNTTDSPRIGQISVEGPGGVTETATVTQSSETITMDVSPKNESVGPASGTSTFEVNSNIDWTVSDNATWLTVSKSDGTEFTADFEANTMLSSRYAQITIEGAGGYSEIVSLTQAGETATLEVSPASESVSAGAGTTGFSVSSNVEWSVSDEASWLSAAKSDNSTINVSFEANNSNDSRSAQIIISGGGITQTVLFTQAGFVALLEVSPVDQSVDASSGTLSFDVQANIDWSPGLSDDASWLTAIKTDSISFSVNYEENPDLLPRTAYILVEGSGGVLETVSVTQASQTVTFYVTPKSQDVDDGSGEISFEISTNIEWDLSFDASWLTAVKSNDSTISVSYDSNPERNPRTAYILVTGAVDISEIISITQSGEALFMELYALSEIVGPGSDSSSIVVESNVDWLVSEEADWLSTAISGDTMLMVYFLENTSTDIRSAEITFYGEGVTSLTYTIEQEGAGTGITNPPGSVNFTVYPNPAKHSIYIRSGEDINSDVLITLFDASGKVMWNSKAERISTNETIGIDISGFHPGLYILHLNYSGQTTTKKIVIR